MTETEAAETTEISNAATAKADRQKATLDLTNGTVTYAGTSYAITDLPPNSRAYLELRGLAWRLQQVEDPATAFADLRQGKTPADRVAKAKVLDDKRMAIALADTDKLAKERDLKAKDPERALILDNAKQAASLLTGADVKEHMKRLSVMTHYAKLTGVAD